MIKKLAQFFLFLVISILSAGLYGVLHNQATFLISKEYFTHFKFLQFGLPNYYRHPEELGAAIIGWSATWWCGLILGLVLGGLWLWENKLTFRYRYRALGIVCITTIVFGLIGAIFSYIYYQPDRYYEVFSFTGYGSEVEASLNSMSDPYAFLRAGTVHNCSYIGGVIGLVLGVLSLWKVRKKYK